jgi:DMSO/TMAO reductase YedYZ heme-binding membrane subunit
MRWIGRGAQALLGLLFLFSAYTKLTGGMDEIRDHLGLAAWFWTLAGMVQVVGAAGLLAVLAGLWLGATMAVGALCHLLAGDTLADASGALVLMAATLAVAALRWRAARLMDLLQSAGRHPQAAAR